MLKNVLNKIFTSIASSYGAAFILALAVWINCLYYPIKADNVIVAHSLTYIFLTTAILFLMLSNNPKPFFLLVGIFLTYWSVNQMKIHFDTDLRYITAFDLVFVLLPINALYFYLIRNKTLYRRQNFIYLCLVLLQTILVEKFYDVAGVEDNLWFYYGGYIVWSVVLIFLIGKICINAGGSDVGYTYGMICVFLGLINCTQDAGMAIYFMASSLILLLSSVFSFIRALFFDPLTGVYSRHSYERQSQKKFPLKYSLGIIFIDNYDNLLKSFGAQTENLVWMIIDKVKSLQGDALIYRYEEDEFILIFKNEDKKTCYEYMEEIRRTIAGTTFVLRKYSQKVNVTKVTISAGISEKKRSDINAEVVLRRTRECVRRAYKFTQNMTSQA